MSENTNQLPADVAVLQARLAAALAERDAAIAERDHVLAQNHCLQHLLQQLRRMQFGRRSEKLDPDQFSLAFRFATALLEGALARGLLPLLVPKGRIASSKMLPKILRQ